MAVEPGYVAAWIPGLKSDFDRDDALRLGERWLRSVAGVNGRIVVMNAKKMSGNNALLARLRGSFEFVSPQARYPSAQKPLAVLAIYPTNDTLDLAGQLALRGALCVIPGTIDDLTGWITRTRAVNLAAPTEEPPAMPTLPEEVRSELDRILFFGGHNGFLGGGEKERCFRGIREFERLPDTPAPEAVETYMLSTGKVRADGARRFRAWYEGALSGKRFKDCRGRYI